MPEKVALLGRPNVGKSTLFNRMIRSKRAITHDRPGVTRDRMEGLARPREGAPFVIVDTGGVTLDPHHSPSEGPAGLRGFETEIFRQAQAAMEEAALLCLVVDGREGLLPLDEHLASLVRRSGKPVLLVVNKVDGPEREDEILADFHRLGFPMVAVSAEHGHNVRALESEIAERLDPSGAAPSPEEAAPDPDESDSDWSGPGGSDADESGPESNEASNAEKPLRLAFLGRPNAGKSSLLNALVGEERMIVSDLAGTTRDSVDVPFQSPSGPCVFVDTAGVRRRSRIDDTLERFSVNASIKSTTKADVTLYVVAAPEGVTAQDKRLIDLLNERRTPFMVLVNKIDLIRSRKELEKDFRQLLSFCPHIPLLMVSATRGLGLKGILPLARQIRSECHTRIGTGQLNRALEEVIAAHQPPVVNRVRPRFFYLTQAEVAPPTFVFFVNDAERVSETYARYLERALRQRFHIKHAPMRIRLRSSHGKKRER